MKLYVGNLSYATTEDTLRDAFSNYGDVISVRIMKDRFTEQSKGFAFVEMGTDIQGERGIGGMNGKSVDGRRIRVSLAVDKPKKEGHEGGSSYSSRGRERNNRFNDDEHGRNERNRRRFQDKKSAPDEY